MEDNWKYRSKKMRCETCMMFVFKYSSVEQSGEEQSGKHLIGRCRKHAPTLSGWPVVFTHDWCGDHKLNEDKLP